MRQITIHEFGTTEVLRLEHVDAPDMAANEILVDVMYAGLNPLDYKMRDGSSGLCANMTLPCSLGREFVGRISAGADAVLHANGLAIGDLVFGMRAHSDLRGTYAQQIAINPEWVAKVPDVPEHRLPHFGGLALVGLTARQAVKEAHIKEGDTVLVHGGAGGVGQLLICMALREGASEVFATSRADNAARIHDLGATSIPYDAVDWRRRLSDLTDGRGVDVIIDTHYFQTFLPSLDHLAEGGRIVVLPSLADLTPAKERGFHAAIPVIAPDKAFLEELASRLANGILPLEVSEIFPMEDIARAHEQLEGGHTRGKLILDLQ